MAKKINVAGQLNAATTEGIIADASQVRINDDSTVDKEVENLNANTGISEYEAFSDQKAYSAGDTVLYNGLLYTFTTDHAIGAWDEIQVEETSLKNILDKNIQNIQNYMAYNGILSVNEEYLYAIKPIRKVKAFTDSTDEIEIYVLRYDDSVNKLYINIREVSSQSQIGYFSIQFDNKPTGIKTILCTPHQYYPNCALYIVLDFSKLENVQSEDCHIKIEKYSLESNLYYGLFKSKDYFEKQQKVNTNFDDKITNNTSDIQGILNATNLKKEFVNAVVIKVEDGFYINFEGDLSEVSSSRINFYQVKEGDTYKIEGSLKLNGLCYAVYNSSEIFTSSTCIYKGAASSVSIAVEINDKLIIPSGGLTLIVWYTFSVKKQEYIYNNIDNTNIIDCWGDSLTAGSGGNGITYPSKLKELLGNNYIVNNYGHGGETAAAISFRQGGLKILFNPFSVLNGSQVTCTFKAINNMSLKTLFSNSLGTEGIDNVFIGDKKIMFRTTANADECVLYNNRGAGDISFERPVMARAEGGGTQHILIICMGQNGTYYGNYDYNLLIGLYKLMLNHNNYDKFIIAGIPTGDKEKWDELEIMLGTEFGEHFFNSREYISKYGLLDNDISPTGNDTDAMELGAIPPSLLYDYPTDPTHMNQSGYNSWAIGLYEKGKQLGYWN